MQLGGTSQSRPLFLSLAVAAGRTRYPVRVIRQQFVRAFTHAALSPDPDLAVAALMIARIEHPRLDAGPYLDQLDALGREAKIRVAAAPIIPGDTPARVDPDRYARVLALNDYLFGELRFVGNDVQYEDPRNSFLNEVLDRRTGIPITLALLYMEVARRAGLHVEGINFPGHFLLRCPARRGLQYSEDLIIDAFHGGALLSGATPRRREAAARPPGAPAAAGTPAAGGGPRTRSPAADGRTEPPTAIGERRWRGGAAAGGRRPR